MSDRKFDNPWSTTAGFTDLGCLDGDGLYYELYCFPQAPAHATFKFTSCIKLAREWSRDSWQLQDARERREHRRLSREALSDARYWREEIRRATVMHIGARFGGLCDYQSASILSTRKHGISRLVCFGYNGPIKEALSRMGQRGLLRETVFDAYDRVLYRPDQTASAA